MSFFNFEQHCYNQTGQLSEFFLVAASKNPRQGQKVSQSQLPFEQQQAALCHRSKTLH